MKTLLEWRRGAVPEGAAMHERADITVDLIEVFPSFFSKRTARVISGWSRQDTARLVDGILNECCTTAALVSDDTSGRDFVRVGLKPLVLEGVGPPTVSSAVAGVAPIGVTSIADFLAATHFPWLVVGRHDGDRLAVGEAVDLRQLPAHGASVDEVASWLMAHMAQLRFVALEPDGPASLVLCVRGDAVPAQRMGSFFPTGRWPFVPGDAPGELSPADWATYVNGARR